jgi:hypothetical protein
MLRITRRTLAISAITAISAGAVIAPTVADAASHKLKVSYAGKQTGVTLSATLSGSPVGKCTMTGKLVIPDTQQVWKCKGGTLKLTGHGTTGAANDAKGTWKVNGGTGKYAKAKGKGVFTGQISTGKFTYTGTLSY